MLLHSNLSVLFNPLCVFAVQISTTRHKCFYEVQVLLASTALQLPFSRAKRRVWRPVNHDRRVKQNESSTGTGLVQSQLVGALSPVNHKELHQCYTQPSTHLLLIPHNNHETAKFIKIHKISLNTNVKQATDIVITGISTAVARTSELIKQAVC